MGVRWVDLSMYGLAMQVHGSAQRTLVLKALPGAAPPDRRQAERMGFTPRNGLLQRDGQQIPLSEIRAVFPQAQVRQVEPEAIRFVQPALSAPTVDQAPLPLEIEPGTTTVLPALDPGPSEFVPAVPGHHMSREAFIRAAHAYQSLGGWHVDLANQSLPVPDEVRVLSPRTDLGVVKGHVHRHVVELADKSDPTGSRLDVLAEYPKLLASGHWYRGRNAETNVTRLLGKLGVLPRMMDWVRLGDGRSDHCRLINPPWQDLAVEVHPGEGANQQRVYLTHYRDDGQADGEMVFGVHYGRLWLTETAVQGFRGELRGCDRSFATMFARNLLHQGFDEATIQWGREDARDRDEEAPAPALRPAL